MDIKNKIKTIEDLLFELKESMEKGEICIEDKASYVNFLYNSKDLILDALIATGASPIEIAWIKRRLDKWR
jgi:hypothetical protein